MGKGDPSEGGGCVLYVCVNEDLVDMCTFHIRCNMNCRSSLQLFFIFLSSVLPLTFPTYRITPVLFAPSTSRPAFLMMMEHTVDFRSNFFPLVCFLSLPTLCFLSLSCQPLSFSVRSHTVLAVALIN